MISDPTHDGTFSTRANVLDGLMLAEHAHRVANDMVIAIAQLELCRVHLRDETAVRALTSVADRLRDLCGVQSRLMRPRNTEVDLDAFVADLAEAVLRARSRNGDVDLRMRLQPLRSDAEFAWRLATVVAELLTNALKHAFTGRRGQLRLSLKACGPIVWCTVGDDGAGMGHGKRRGSGHGSGIVDALVAQMGGRVMRRSSPAGMTVHLSALRPVRIESRAPLHGVEGRRIGGLPRLAPARPSLRDPLRAAFLQ